jgi:hypothetical protein
MPGCVQLRVAATDRQNLAHDAVVQRPGRCLLNVLPTKVHSVSLCIYIWKLSLVPVPQERSVQSARLGDTMQVGPRETI